MEPIDLGAYKKERIREPDCCRVLSTLEQSRRIATPSGQVVSVLPPLGEGAFRWHPRDLRIPLEELRKSYDPEVFAAFERDMRSAVIEETGVTVWEWLNGAENVLPPTAPTVIAKPTPPTVDSALRASGLDANLKVFFARQP